MVSLDGFTMFESGEAIPPGLEIFGLVVPGLMLALSVMDVKPRSRQFESLGQDLLGP